MFMRSSICRLMRSVCDFSAKAAASPHTTTTQKPMPIWATLMAFGVRVSIRPRPSPAPAFNWLYRQPFWGALLGWINLRVCPNPSRAGLRSADSLRRQCLHFPRNEPGSRHCIECHIWPLPRPAWVLPAPPSPPAEAPAVPLRRYRSRRCAEARPPRRASAG
jgi:hypothetical protein